MSDWRPQHSPSDWGRVAVLFGGDSAERDISLNSGGEVLRSLQASGVRAEAFDTAERPFEQLRDYDAAFIVLHGRGGEDGVIQAVLEMLGVPYTGTGVMGSALGMDKMRSKWLWKGMGMPVAEAADLTADTDFGETLAALGGDVMVKPSREGSSIGMARARSADELRDAYEAAAAFDSDVMAERWITGAEYTVSLLDGKALPAIRLQTPRGFYDYEAKYVANTTEYQCPCGLDAEQEAAMAELAERAYSAIDGLDWGRVDIMIDTQGRSYLLEANTVPGMTDHSLVPMAAKAKGISFDELVLRILQAGLARGAR